MTTRRKMLKALTAAPLVLVKGKRQIDLDDSPVDLMAHVAPPEMMPLPDGFVSEELLEVAGGKPWAETIDFAPPPWLPRIWIQGSEVTDIVSASLNYEAGMTEYAEAGEPFLVNMPNGFKLATLEVETLCDVTASLLEADRVQVRIEEHDRTVTFVAVPQRVESRLNENAISHTHMTLISVGAWVSVEKD